MKQFIFFLMLSIFFIGCKNEKVEDAKDVLVLLDFDTNFKQSQVIPQDATFELIKNSDDNLLKVNSGFTADKPGVVIKESADKPWDLTGYKTVKADVTNKGDEAIQVEMFVGDDPDGLVKWYCSDYMDINPGETRTIAVNLAWTEDWAFSPQIEVNGMRGVPGKLKTDIQKINQVSFNSRYAKNSTHYTVDNIRAEGKLEIRNPKNFFPFIDEFGQFIHKDWEGKMHSNQDLVESAKNELAHLNKSIGPKNIGKFGGYTKGPKLKATGFFRTEKVNNKWWIVDPEGYIFWTAGLNCVASDAVYTGVSDRENYFKELPSRDSDFGQFYSKGTFTSHGFYLDKLPYDAYNFYQSNLFRKYGDDWLASFRDVAHKRIKDWGMNTIGFMSDFGATKQHRTPYVGSIWIKNTPKILGSEGFWGKFHDVFDPAFRIAVKNSIESQKEGANDPWCIGYFVDNELSWGLPGFLAIGVLKSDKSQQAKIKFIKNLKNKYKKIEVLNAVWKTKHNSWDDLLKSTIPPNEANAKEDLIAFYGEIVDTYFRIINEELKKTAPNQNYLGCRFAWANNDIVLSTAGKYLDIMSFNKYEYSIENFKLPKGVDKPVMIGEFHFGALDKGSFHVGIKKARNQAERGQMYQDYIRGALRHPNIVGAHWFQYIDEPNTGRFDGENYNVGFVDIADNPFEDLIKKVKETTYSMYDYRINNSFKQ
ncbi:beta-galactosidase [Polaribacter porphyrae]|uniref:Beta-agarase n=1 Tax=Polaribacter porphyrae TaxID=1137780 RepID=A0A2S7WTK8_9FLAO|nr:beta-galactosidase [Polaribacter porphyrae]PQJ80652.1 beta-agarase [Polaribacter porphyrae]